MRWLAGSQLGPRRDLKLAGFFSSQQAFGPSWGEFLSQQAKDVGKWDAAACAPLRRSPPRPARGYVPRYFPAEVGDWVRTTAERLINVGLNGNPINSRDGRIWPCGRG